MISYLCSVSEWLRCFTSRLFVQTNRVKKQDTAILKSFCKQNIWTTTYLTALSVPFRSAATRDIFVTNLQPSINPVHWLKTSWWAIWLRSIGGLIGWYLLYLATPMFLRVLPLKLRHKILGSIENQTWDCWFRSASAISVPVKTLHKLQLNYKHW